MAIPNRMSMLAAILILFFLPHSQQLQSSQAQTLLRIQKLLEFPKALDSLSNATDFCSLPPSESLTIVCRENTITQLAIVGDKPSPDPSAKNGALVISNRTLSKAFSAVSFFTTLTKLYSLKSVSLVSLGIWGPLSSKLSRLSSLEILNLTSNFLHGAIPYQFSELRKIKTFILDNNMFNGNVPEWFSALPNLEFLSLKNNRLSGYVPHSLSSLQELRGLALSGNSLSGDLPDFSTMTSLQVLDVGDNALGPDFPTLGKALGTVSLRKNRFRCHIPMYVRTLNQLKYLDVSFNALTGSPPSFLFSLPAIAHINLAGNSLRGSIPQNVSCSHTLRFVDLSANLLTGRLPSCLMAISDEKTVNVKGNCLATNMQPQHRYSHCQAARVSKKTPITHKKRNLIGFVGIITGGLAVLLLVAFMVCVMIRRARYKKRMRKNKGKLVPETASTGISSELLVNARYISQGMKLGTHGLPQYRRFALEELEEATNNFDESALMGEGSHGKLYKGRMADGNWVAIRCLKLQWKPTMQKLKLHMELFSKLRHHNLVSLLGHCIDSELDGSAVKRVFLIFEFVSNGTLQSHLSGNTLEESLTWSQRLTTISGVARAIHFLHTGIVPGVNNNNLKITNVLLDQNYIAKLSDYDLPGLTTNAHEFEAKTEGHKYTQKETTHMSRKKTADKTDIYNFGLILLETMVGKFPTMQSKEADKVHEMVNLISDQESRRNIVDPAILNTCIEESLQIVAEITAKCLSQEPASRPSIEDVLWNIQYAAQVQDTTASDLQSEENK